MTLVPLASFFNFFFCAMTVQSGWPNHSVHFISFHKWAVNVQTVIATLCHVFVIWKEKVLKFHRRPQRNQSCDAGVNNTIATTPTLKLPAYCHVIWNVSTVTLVQDLPAATYSKHSIYCLADLFQESTSEWKTTTLLSHQELFFHSNNINFNWGVM